MDGFIPKTDERISVWSSKESESSSTYSTSRSYVNDYINHYKSLNFKILKSSSS